MRANNERVLKRLGYLCLVFVIIFILSGCGGGGGSDDSGGSGGGGNGDVVEEIIGPGGGVLEDTNPESPIYGAKFSFPPGSVEQDTIFSMKYDDLYDSDNLMANPVIVDHPDIQLHEDVNVTLQLREVPTEDAVLLVIVFDDETNSYVPEGTVTYVLAGDTMVEFQLTHLSTISVAEAFDRLSALTSICDKIGGPPLTACFPTSEFYIPGLRKWKCETKKVSDSRDDDCMGRCGERCPEDDSLKTDWLWCEDYFRYTQACFWHDACQRYHKEIGDPIGLPCQLIDLIALNDCKDAPICTEAREVCNEDYPIDNNDDGQVDEGCEGLQLDLEYRYPISPGIKGIGLSPDDSTLYEAYWTDTWSDRVEWFSAEAPYNFIDYVAYGRCHADVGVSSNNRYVFTTTYYSNNVSRFDLWNNKAQTTLPTTSWPAALALTPDRSKMVVFGGMGSDVNDALHIFNISNNNFYELNTIPLADYLNGDKMAFTANGDYGYFLTAREAWGSGPAKLHEVSLNSLTITKSVELPSQNCYGIAHAFDKLYVYDSDNSRIRVYNRQTLTEDYAAWPMSNQPSVLAIPPDKSGLFVLLPEAPGGGALEVLNLSNGNKIGGYPNLGCGNTANDIEFNSDGSKAYISCFSGDVLVLNVNSN